MKVYSLGIYTENRVKANSNSAVLDKKPAQSYTSSPSFAPMHADMFKHYALSFGDNKFLINMHSWTFKNMPCPCCGKKMINRPEFLSVFADHKIPENGAEAVKLLQPYAENMHEVERKCFEVLKKESEAKPERTVREIFGYLKTSSINKLKVNQISVFNQIDTLCKTAPVKEVRGLRNYITVIRKNLHDNNYSCNFKRKDFIEKIADHANRIGDKKLRHRIKQVSLELNNSQNDVDAFIVKYSKRTTKEIVQRLIIRSTASIEHILPKSPLDGPIKGTNDMGNLMLECAACNNDRGNIPFHEWLNLFPDMPKNAQKYFDYMIEKANNGELEEYKQFIKPSAESLERESHGKVKIDLSKLKVETPV